MKVLVTGGAGFIGHHIVRRLLSSGHEVVVLDNLSRGSFKRPELHDAVLVKGDVRSESDCAWAVRGCQAVIHLAAQSNVMGAVADPTLSFQCNVVGTWTIARAAVSQRVETFIYTSSREVYGEPKVLPVSEASFPCPKNAYGVTKFGGEVALAAFAGSMSTAILRLSNVVGSGDRDRVIPLWAERLRLGASLVLYGGQQQIDFVPVSTVCHAIEQSLVAPSAEPTNVGSGVSLRLKDVAESLVSMVETGSTVEVVEARSEEVTRFCADVSRMEAVLGIKPQADPMACIKEVVFG